MIDHLGLPVADHARSRAFQVRALAPIGFAHELDVTHAAVAVARETVVASMRRDLVPLRTSALVVWKPET